MSIKFSKEGPAFPEKLVDAMLTGDVIFLCGSGVSAPQLPMFKPLVVKCYELLGVEKSSAEQDSFKYGRYEEVLGALSRRLVDPSSVTRAVVDQLKRKNDYDLANHHIILRLSRNLDNRPVIVTTNFDTLLEAAMAEKAGIDQVRNLSFSGQDLPSPGSTGFGGVIHLHGRVGDEELGLDQTPLVVTSADYGDAYMRSGWASRFLFDLCRCKTIILIGYSAGDAPVRYFLNVLEADRQRFPELHTVYALDSVESFDAVDTRWEALAVEPIVYEKVPDSATGKPSHIALWRDLDLLAELVERPFKTRQEWARKILSKPLIKTTPEERDLISWLYSSKNDLYVVAANTILDQNWFNYLFETKNDRDANAAWTIATWCTKELESMDRLETALKWRRLGKPLSDTIENIIYFNSNGHALWVKAWRVVAAHLKKEDKNDFDAITITTEKLRTLPIINADIMRAIALLTPALKLEIRHERQDHPPSSLFDLFFVECKVTDEESAPDLVSELIELPQAKFVLSTAAAALTSFIGKAIDVGAIHAGYDRANYDVPSVEPHEQNAHRGGANFLVQIIAQLLPKLSKSTPSSTRLVTESLRGTPGLLGIRIWLHSLRMTELYSSDEAITGINELPIDTFWQVKRELALAVRDRSASASKESVLLLERRIIEESEIYFNNFVVEKGQVDWRQPARDREVWLRLSMLKESGVLSEIGLAEINSIRGRHDYLDGAIEERDFFSSYSFGVRTVVGNAQPLFDADSESRLEVAQQVIQSQDIESQMGWHAYCGSDPSGAYETLQNSNLDAINAPLWETLIGSLAFRNDDNNTVRNDIVLKIFEKLEHATDEFISLLVGRLSSLYVIAPRRTTPSIANWWPRLFGLGVIQPCQNRDSGHELYGDAINSPTGRLTEILLIDIDQFIRNREPVDPTLLESFSETVTKYGTQRVHALAILVKNINFVKSFTNQTLLDIIKNDLSDDDANGPALRSILVSMTAATEFVYQDFSREILRGVKESLGQERDDNAAAKVLLPALSLIRNEPDATKWNISLDEVRDSLRKGSLSLRRGAANLLKNILLELNKNGAGNWNNVIGPLIESVWPRERSLNHNSLTPYFADLIAGSKEEFPMALNQMLPYLTKFEGRSGFIALKKSDLLENFPGDCLTLLWRLFGPGTESSMYDIPIILERIINAEPALEFDRRLQWLELHSTHRN